MKKPLFFLSILAIIVATTMSIAYVLAKPEKARGPSEKTTGKFSYQAGALEGSIEMSAHEQKSAWIYSDNNWNIVGDWDLIIVFGVDDYWHDLIITSQVEGNLIGSGSYPSGGPPSAAWTLSGTISGNNVNLTINYDGISYNETLVGTISADGSISGTYTNSGGSSGTWSANGNAVLAPNGYTGKGQLRYSDSNDVFYDVSIEEVNVRGDMAYFAGPVTKASDSAIVGKWLSSAVHDGDGLTVSADRVWSVLTDMPTAKFNILNTIAPGSVYEVTDGNLKVHAN